MIKKLNLEDIKSSARELVMRFPAALSFLLLLTAWFLLHSWDKVYNIGDYHQPDGSEWFCMTEIHDGTIFYYLSVATILSIVLVLWGEEVRRRRTVWIVTALSHLLLLADACFLWSRPEGSIDTELVLAHGASCTALLIAGVFLPYFRERDDLASWNLALRMVAYSIICSLACGVVLLGLILLLNSFDWLFGMKVEEHWYSTLATILFLTTAGALWMSRLPKGEKKFNRNALTSKFLTGMVRYLFLPLVLVYLVVLYIYAAKILFTMQLPKGGVCALIIVLMVGCLGIELLLYPLQRKVAAESSKPYTFEQWLVRWLPVIILPLLVLMSVAIGRRISDYGITIDRLYVVTLNLWFYAVCIGLYLTRARRIHWIPLSFGVLFLLTSVLPVNFCTLTRDTILGRIDSFMASHEHPELPMNEASYKTFMDEIPVVEAENLREDLTYLNSFFGHEIIDRFVDKEVYIWRIWTIKPEKETFSYEYNRGSIHAVPAGCSEFYTVAFYEGKYNRFDSTEWRITIDDTLSFMIDLNQLPAADASDPWFLQELNGKGILGISELSIDDNWNDSITSRLSIDGYFFQ